MAERQAEGAASLIRSIPVDQIRPGAHQARRHFNRPALEELVASIREHGILQPVLVRPQGEWYELVAGERRWRAAREAGLVTVPAVVREMSEREAAVAGLVENLQREDLPFFEEADAYRQLLEEFRMSQEALATELGKSQPAIANKIRLLKLEPAVREEIIRANLGERHARALLRLEGEPERLRAVAALVRANMNARQAEAWVARELGEQPQKRTRPQGVLRDLRIYLNAVDEVADRLREAGFPAEVTRAEDEFGWSVHLRIGHRQAGSAPKRRRA